MTEAAKRGKAGEEACAHALQMFGFRLLERNRRAGRLEIDILAERHGKPVVVEVRAREAGGLVNGAESITSQKWERVEAAAKAVTGRSDPAVMYASVVLRDGIPSEIEFMDESF